MQYGIVQIDVKGGTAVPCGFVSYFVTGVNTDGEIGMVRIFVPVKESEWLEIMFRRSGMIVEEALADVYQELIDHAIQSEEVPGGDII